MIAYHTYKLSPQRVVWNIQKLGLLGEIDHYAGVFWWRQTTRVGGNFPSTTVTFGGTWVVLTITTRSTGTNWLYTLTPETNSAA